MSIVYNPWHGCTRFSEGCKNCYVYRRDTSVGRDASVVMKNRDFDLPVRVSKRPPHGYTVSPGTLVYTCMTSDFFLDKADGYRAELWQMMRQRADLDFMIITKRIERFYDCIPDDWGQGYPNVFFCCTMENQRRCDERFPVLNGIPAAKKFVACEPLLTHIDMSRYLNGGISQVIAGGESGNEARICRYEWILDIRRQCCEAGVPFYFKQTGARFEKDGKLYRVPRRLQHIQAKKANINTSQFIDK